MRATATVLRAVLRSSLHQHHAFARRFELLLEDLLATLELIEQAAELRYLLYVMLLVFDQD